jgi:hypothetical protein
VYALWDTKLRKVAYVGQTSSLRDRMSDLSHSVNHTCRRKIGRILGIASASEKRLSAAMAKRYAISFLEVLIGRLELEDYLKLRWRPSILNGPSKRLLKGRRYTWVTASSPTFALVSEPRSPHSQG